RGVVFFGSRYVGTTPNVTSACDLFVIVESYAKFYRMRIPGVKWAFSPPLLTSLNRVLPPNILSLFEEDGAGAKFFVISVRDFNRATSRHSPDHFVKGRLTQDVLVIDARDDAARRQIQSQLSRARESSLDWVPHFLPGAGTKPFRCEEYCIRMLQISYAAEIRPEPQSRVREVYDAQRDFFETVYGGILANAAGRSELVREDAHYRCVKAAGAMRRLRSKAYFRSSKVRATLRWLKYTMTFADWLDYLIRKVERRTGLSVEVTSLERRLPFLLLWPKVFRVLRERNAGGRQEPRPADRIGP
ncbi:MAG TPA: hypothetical protein VFR10_01835, partial [bacterium]|nr:hypothetical protein [bacterium]